MSLDAYRESWKIVAYRESWKIVKYTRSPQGPHIGMYKIAAHQPLLGWIFHQKSEITYLSRYSLRQQRTCTDVMLPGNTTPGI